MTEWPEGSDGSAVHECPICGAECDCEAGGDACEHDCREDDYDDWDD